MFYEWLIARRVRPDPIGDLARDAARDRHFPTNAEALANVLEYLRSRQAGEGALVAARKAWREYNDSETRERVRRANML